MKPPRRKPVAIVPRTLPPEALLPLQLEPLKAQHLALREDPTSGPNPALVYHDSKSRGSQPAIRAVLGRIGGWLLGLGRPAAWDEVCKIPWWEVRARHLAVLRGRLAEVSAPRTTNRDLSILRSVLKVAWSNEMMTTDVYQRTIVERGVPKDSTKAGRALTPDEIRALMGACAEMEPPEGPRAAAILAIMYGAGLRRIEIARLQVADVAQDTGAIQVHGKRNKKRTAYLAPGWVRYLRAWIDVRGDASGAFISHGSSGYSVNGIADLVEVIRTRAGVAAFTPHDLRRSFGTHLLSAGNDISLVKDLMGHEDVRTTIVYDRRGENEKKAAVVALSPDSLEQAARFMAAARTPPRENGYSLAEIFHLGEGFGEFSVEALTNLADAIEAKRVVMTTFVPPTIPPPSDVDLAQFSGRTDAHRLLCAEAAAYISSRGWTWTVAPRFLYYAGGTADVAEIGGRLFIECGYTQSGKVLRGVQAGKEVAVMPYLGVTPTLGFLFSPGEAPFPEEDPVARGASSRMKLTPKEKKP